MVTGAWSRCWAHWAQVTAVTREDVGILVLTHAATTIRYLKYRLVLCSSVTHAGGIKWDKTFFWGIGNVRTISKYDHGDFETSVPCFIS